MEEKDRLTGSVRINKKMREEMDTLGIPNPSAYVKHKMELGASRLEAIKTAPEKETVRQLPAFDTIEDVDPQLKDQLTIQRLAMENRKLQDKLKELTQSTQDTLNGVQHKVHHMLQEELQKRDYEELKSAEAQKEKLIAQLEKGLDDARKDTEDKQKEIEALVKKLGFVELGKALLPGAISGLAKQYPNQMKGIAGTLGSLGLSEVSAAQNDPQQQHLLQILDYLQEVFTEEQLEQLLQLMVQAGDQLADDPEIIRKMGYYLHKIKKAPAASKGETDTNN